jgi:hypothetical protein
MPKSTPKPSAADLIQSEVIANILSQPLGTATLADLNLPREFVVRIADRITRASFNERHRLVVALPLPEEGDLGEGSSSVLSSPAPRDGGVTQVAARATEGSSCSSSQREGAGGRVLPSIDQVDQRDRFASVQPQSSPTVQILDRPLSPETLRLRQQLAEARPANRAFSADDNPALFNTPTSLPPPDLIHFTPTVPNFRLLPDDATHQPRALRLQLTRGTDYAAPTDGGSLDMLRHIAAALPEMPLFVSVERKHVADARTACEDFAAARSAPITLVVEDLPVAQWAHDNAKPGLANGQAISLLPRYASRGEDGSLFIPGESFLHNNLAAAGIAFRRSPLHFQGGNLIAFHAPFRDAGHALGDLALLVGEAELARNTAMGLLPEQALDLFRAEFGVARVEVLPAISYHIDLEMSIRRRADGRVLAFVIDQPAAVRLVLRAGLEALARAGYIAPARSAFLQERLDRGPMNEFLAGAWSDLARFSTRPGHVLESLAPSFAIGASDSGVGNVQRYMLALDLLAAELPPPAHLDPHAAAMLASVSRRERERRGLRQKLQSLGLETVLVPGLSDADRSLNALNGIHLPDAFLMPTYGGLYHSVDRKAVAVFERTLGPEVRILRIPSGESQRREGAVRCAVGVIC